METNINFIRYGRPDGRLAIYFHGAPGSPLEAALFEPLARKHDLTVISLDRFSIDPAIRGEAYFEVLATEIKSLTNGKKVAVIGFSIGAFVALQTCKHLGDQIESLHLVSSAAPLEAGPFLDAMAGKPVFKLAKIAPGLFLLLSYWQALLARLAPTQLFHMLFRSATGSDQLLASDPNFQSEMIKVLKAGFIGRVPGYVRDVKAYVQPWAATLGAIQLDAHIWHGEADNWSPKQMAEYLQSTLVNCSQLEILDGLSHYSCLYHAGPRICSAIAPPKADPNLTSPPQSDRHRSRRTQ